MTCFPVEHAEITHVNGARVDEASSQKIDRARWFVAAYAIDRCDLIDVKETRHMCSDL